MKKFVGFACLGLALIATASGCTYSIHQVQVSDFTPYAALERGDIVKGYGEQFVIMGFTQQTDYVNVAYQNLMNACPGGNVSGITTQISTAHNFFSWTNKALMQGLCLKGAAATGASTGRPRKPASESDPGKNTSANLTDWVSEEI